MKEPKRLQLTQPKEPGNFVGCSYLIGLGSVTFQSESHVNVHALSVVCFLIWRGSNWVKESQYGLDHKTIEQNT